MTYFCCVLCRLCLGMRGSNTGELVFDNVEVPEENVLGKLNGGARIDEWIGL